MGYVSLHNHSQFSILDSTISVKNLAKAAAEAGMQSVGISDAGNLYGVVDFFKACKQEGVKPIIGIELMIAPEGRADKKRISGKQNGYPVVLIAKNKTGYENLCKLSSDASIEGFYYYPRTDKEFLKAHAEGLICLSGSSSGPIGAAVLSEDGDALEQELTYFTALFGDDFYLELRRHAMEEAHLEKDGIRQEVWLLHEYEDYLQKQKRVNDAFLKISKEKSILLVATNDVHYLKREDWYAHEILLNVQSGEPCEIWERDSFGNPKSKAKNPKRKVFASHEHYFKDEHAMRSLFADIPEAIDNTELLSQKVDFAFDFEAKHYPVFYPPGVEETAPEELRAEKAAEYLRQLCNEGIPEKYTPAHLEKVAEKYPGEDPLEVVRKRLEYELEIITTKNLCDYLLIVFDFIHWAKKSDIPVGPGRGSGAGSIILYLIGITDIEPLRFNLFFERFINPERLSYPDIDVDICMERRSEVIDYTLQKYGRDKVAQIITFGTMKAKMAIKDVGRVLSVPLAKVNDIAKLVPEDPTMTLSRALELDPELKALYEADAEAKEVLDIGLKVEGSIRNTGVHAAGLIISGSPLTNHIPVCVSKDADIVTTQYAMKPVESVGMLKIDFLGLKTLTSIQKACNAASKKKGEPIDWMRLPLDDTATFELLNKGKTQGIFQLESGGMQELAKNLHIDKFEEIIAVGALYRPGPMEMIPSFINRKHGREEIEIDHPLMKEIIQETYGIMVYQEQVMQISQVLAKYTLGEGDVLRRAMGKKDRVEMARQREKFKQGSIANNIDPDLSMKIFDKIEKFASYGFNKSHAAAYGYLSYVTAYFKANYPMEWMASLMTCDIDDISKVAKHIRECQTMEIDILPPDVNEAGVEFVATSKGIRFAMSGIKGVGRGVVDAVIEEREKKGAFQTFDDFLKRIDTKRVGKKAIESLIDAGCFDFTGCKRKALQMVLPAAFETAQRKRREEEKGFLDMFAEIEKEMPLQAVQVPDEEYEEELLLSKEKELLGFYLTGHPMETFKDAINSLGCVSLADVEGTKEGKLLKIAGIIDVAKVKISQKSGRKFAICDISDGVNRFEVPIWPAMYEENPLLYVENALFYGIVQVEGEEGGKKLRARYMADLKLVDDATPERFAQEYERVKELAKSDLKRKQKEEKRQLREENKPKYVLKLMLDVHKVKMSNLLSLKERFIQSAGDTQVDLIFVDKGKPLGKVEIPPTWGVKTDQTLKDYLLTLPFITTQSIETI